MWPDIAYQLWRDTCAALHLYALMIGKYRLACPLGSIIPEVVRRDDADELP